MNTALRASSLTDMDLFRSEYRIVERLVELADEQGRVELSISALAAACGVHRNTAHQGVLRLEQAGLVRIERRTETGKGSAGKRPNIYIVREELRVEKGSVDR